MHLLPMASEPFTAPTDRATVVAGMRLDQVLLVDEHGQLHMTPAMQARVKRVSATP